VLIAGGDGQAGLRGAAFGQRSKRPPQQFVTHALAAHGRRGADLRDVAHSPRHHAGERNALHPPARAVQRHPGRRLEEGAATGVLHDVEQEAARAFGGAVLVVDLAVDVPAIGHRDHLGGVVLPALGPVVEDHAVGPAFGQLLNTAQVVHHEVPLVGARVVGGGQHAAMGEPRHHQLRFDPPHSAGVHKLIDHRPEQPVLEFGRAKFLSNEKVADQPLVLLAHVVRVADRLIAHQQSEPVERVDLDEAAHQFGRSAEVPVELLPPGDDFLGQHRRQFERPNLPEICQGRNPSLGRGGHRPHYTGKRPALQPDFDAEPRAREAATIGRAVGNLAVRLVPEPAFSAAYDALGSGDSNADKEGMSTGSINNLSSLQSILANAVQGAGLTTKTNNSGLSGIVASLSQGSDSGALSPFAQLMSTLQQLQQSNPSQYAQVTKQIATNLTTAAQTAQSQGNTTEATQLNQLATDFNTASTSGQLPNVQDLAQAMGGGQSGVGGHHHHHHAPAASSDSSSDSSTSSSSSTTSSTSSSQMLTQLLAALEGNTTQSDALNPMSIIMSTLSSAGITTSSS